MMIQELWFLLYCIIAFISLITCIIVCITIYHIGYNPFKCFISPNKEINQSLVPKNNSNHIMMIDIIFFMCVVDGLHCVSMILNWLPQALSLPFWKNISCQIIAGYAMFFSMQSPLWHILLAYHLGYLLLGYRLTSLNKQKKYQYILINVPPIILTILPIFFGEYGDYVTNNTDHDCWLLQPNWQLIQVILTIISLLFHYIVVILAFIKYRESFKHNYSNVSVYLQRVMIRLFRFVLCYTIIWILPTIERILEFYHNTPNWLVRAHHISIASLGFANGIIWIINQKCDTKIMDKEHQTYNETTITILTGYEIPIDSEDSSRLTLTSNVIERNNNNNTINDIGDIISDY